MSVKVFINEEEQEVKMWKFPTGEVGVQLLNPISTSASDYAIVEVMFSCNDDIFYALNLINALENIGFKKHQILLEIPYLPYSRQDRVCHPGESFASKVLIDMLSTSGVTIRTYDLHSETYKANNLMNVRQYVCTMKLPRFDLLIGPDKGSAGKVSSVAECLGVNYVVLDKVRTENGIKITLPGGFQNAQIENACIVDDLLDGGMTFIKAAEVIKEVNPDINLSLYITHGFFTAGIDKLKEMYDNIYCKFLYSTNPAVKAFVKEI